MRATSFAAIIATTATLGLPGAPALAQEKPDQQLGTVHFATSCNETAQRRFDRAMRYQHSFWYKASREIFEDTLKADPACGIAYWGIALSLWNNPHFPPPAPNLAPALAAIEKAKAVGAKSERERDYINALAVLYTDYDKVEYRPRLQAYLKAMEALAAKYPDDDEAQIYYAITLNVSASPGDKTYAQQLKGAAILEPIFRRQPHHPGVAHWKESIVSNLASIKAAKADKEAVDQLHGMDYMVYAYLQLGRDREARGVIDEMMQTANTSPDVYGGSFALAAAPARYAIERGDWKAAAALEVRASKFPAIPAVTHFARALGAARSGNPEAAKADLAKLVELRDKLREAKDAYWADQVEIQRQVATAWVLNAEGKYDEALAAMKAAAEAEDKTEKSPVTPGPLAPARELYGDMLLERGNAKEALAAFQATMAKERNRFNGFVGAAKAAVAAGDKAAAKADYEKLIALADGNSDRPALAAARAYIAAN
jgi:tetratricopeptide (TPR) repeat protein